MKLKHFFAVAIVALILGSCATPQNITYVQDADQLSSTVLANAAVNVDPVIQPGDILQINVSSSDPEVVKPFNKTEYIAKGASQQTGGGENSIYYYLVDNDGNIDFPLLGRIKVGGSTQSAAQNTIANLIYPRFITEMPTVEIRFQNFHVYTMGEVGNPGERKAANGRMNILEAIALSGDLTIKGKRENVLVIRTNADGSRQVHRVDLTDKNLLTSPYYNLQQNDIVYVEPNDSQKRSSWTMPPAWSLGLTLLGTVMSVTTFVITLTK